MKSSRGKKHEGHDNCRPLPDKTSMEKRRMPICGGVDGCGEVKNILAFGSFPRNRRLENKKKNKPEKNAREPKKCLCFCTRLNLR